MKCESCSEYIYRGRKFNARKEITDERYLSRQIIRFYIRCTRCSAEITFKTDPKNTDFTCEKGARRNFEPWREAKLAEETEEERLDRLQLEEENRDAMAELEQKTFDAKAEMQVADALDEIRNRNAVRESAGNGVVAVGRSDTKDEEREKQEREDEEAARRAFQSETGDRIRRIAETDEDGNVVFAGTKTGAPPSVSATTATPAFQRTIKKKKNHAAALGIKRKEHL
jgi:hypothetical protein